MKPFQERYGKLLLVFPCNAKGTVDFVTCWICLPNYSALSACVIDTP